MKNLKILLLLLLVMLGSPPLYAQLKGQAIVDSFLEELPRQKEDTLKAALLGEICVKMYSTGDLKWMSYGEQSLALSTKLNWRRGMIRAAYGLGASYFTRKNFPKSLEYYKYALRLSEQTGYKKGMYGNLMQIANVYMATGDRPLAIEYFTKAAALSEAERDSIVTPNIYMNLGTQYLAQRDYPQTLQCYLKALKIYDITGDTNGTAYVQMGLSLVYSTIRDYPRSIDYALKSLEGYTRLKKEGAISVMNMNIADIYRQMGNYPKAISFCTKALKSFEAQRDTGEMGSVYNVLAETYLQLKKYTSAARTSTLGLKYSLSTGYTPDIALSQKCLGCAYLLSVTDPCPPIEDSLLPRSKAERLRLADLYLKKGLETADKERLTETSRDCCEMLALIYKMQGNVRRSFEYYERFAKLKDSTTSAENSRSLVQMQMQYEYEKKDEAMKAEQDRKDLMAREEMAKQKLVRNGFIGGFAIMLLFAGIFLNQRNKIKEGKKQSDELLLNILPTEVAEELKSKGSAEARLIDEVTVLFTDFKGFTQLAERLSAKELVNEINTCFSAFDEIMQKHGVEKIKTIGDAYMAAGGLPTPNKTHAEDVVRAAIEIQTFMQQHKATKEALGELFFEVRIGIHTGPVVAGIVGIKKFAYDIWGDTVNTAARMESSGSVGMVNISETTYNLVKNKFNCTYRGEVEAKGKGVMKMYFVR